MVRTIALGLALRGDTVVGVEIARKVPSQVIEFTRSDGESDADLLRRVLSDLRGVRHRAARIGVAVGDSRGQAGPLYGLAESSSEHEATAALLRAPEGFFLGMPGELVAGRVWRTDEDWSGAVVSRSLVESLGVAIEERDRIAGLLVVDESADLAASAAEAAILDATAPRVVDVGAAARLERNTRTRRLGLVVATILLAAWAAAAPTLIRMRQLGQVRDEIARVSELRDRQWTTLRTLSLSPDLVLTSTSLRADRTSLSDVFRALANAIPDSSAIISLRMDDSSGTLVVLSADVPAAIARTSARSEFQSLRIAGAITLESQSGVLLQRATLAWGTRDARTAPVGRFATGLR